MTKGLASVDASKLPPSIAGLLQNPNALANPAAMQGIKAKLPEKLLPEVIRFMDQVKQVMATSIHATFTVSIVIAAIALVIVLFTQEIPLSKVSVKK